MKLDSIHTCIAGDLADVETALQQHIWQVCGHDRQLRRLYAAFKRSQGKRLRPRLVILSACAVSGQGLDRLPVRQVRDDVIGLAAVVELVHAASLMHDDVLDGALTRRGIPSLNAEFGEKTAILAGDIMYSRAFESMLEIADAPTTKRLVHCVRRMCRGEVVNLSASGGGDYESIIDGKTASLMEFCCWAGGCMGARDQDLADRVVALEQFGHSFGMAYQLADDLCDGDVANNLATPACQLQSLRLQLARATKALTQVPDSPYSRGLAGLLDFIVATTNRSIGIDVLAESTEERRAVVGAR